MTFRLGHKDVTTNENGVVTDRETLREAWAEVCDADPSYWGSRSEQVAKMGEMLGKLMDSIPNITQQQVESFQAVKQTWAADQLNIHNLMRYGC